jgi:hypothetical protein
MPLDHKVTRLEDEDLAREANNLRALAGIPMTRATFDVVDLLYHVVLPALARMGKAFRVVVDDDSHDLDDPAYVDLRQRVLHIASWVLRAARSGDLFARLIVAHEIAHMVLHKDQVMAFSDDNAVKLNFLQEPESAESQAHHFALYLLFPDAVVAQTKRLDVDTAALVVLLDPEWIAARRTEYETDHKVSLQNYTGDQCEDCGGFSVLQLANATKCETCGSTATT